MFVCMGMGFFMLVRKISKRDYWLRDIRLSVRMEPLGSY
jgi:hypothetical protein